MTASQIVPSPATAPHELRRRLLQAGAAMLAGPALLGACATAGSGDPLVARTTAGAVRGQPSGKAVVFKGVPYGASTAGAGRFMPPKPPAPWTGTREALAYGPSAPGMGYPPVLMREEGVDLGLTPASEDSLVLNIWTPAVGSGRRPVMLWLHGGGYGAGSGASQRYDGTRLAERQDVVVVTINHRLAALGFMDLSGFGDPRFAQSANLGMQDIVRSLEWVRDNISAFGGDAGNVTVFGESGGGGKVSTLMAMPSARGLFHRAIAESGNAIKASTPEEAKQAAQGVLGKLGVGAGQMDALLTMPFDKLIAASPPNLGPVVDGRVLPRHPFDPDGPAVSAQVPLLIGTNLTEVTFFNDTPLTPIDDATLGARVAKYTGLDAAAAQRLIALYKRNSPQAPNQLVYQMIGSDWWLTANSHLQAERKAAQGGAPAYVYQFAMRQGARGGALNVPHTAEIAYVFDNLALSTALVGEPTAVHQQLADQVSGAWCTFARTGNPNGAGLPNWQPYSAASRFVMVLDGAPRQAPAFLAEQQAAILKMRPA